jgi:uncharacterized membrane protein YgcG
MNDPRGRFHPSELDIALDADSAELLATARDIEAYAHGTTVAPSVGFEDRVMAAIANEPMPRPSTRLGFVAFVRDAWAAAFGAGRPLAVRAQGLALLLLLAVAIGSVGSVVAVGAGRLLAQQGPTPSPVLPSPSPSVSPSPSPSPSPTPTPTPTPSATPSATPTETASRTATENDEPSGTDDSGGGSGNSGPGGGEDSGGNSGPGGGGGSGSDDSGSGSED